jgi:hypothetical protein
MVTSNDADRSKLKQTSLKFILGFGVLIVLLFWIDWPLCKFLVSYKAAFWIAVCIHLILLIELITKYKSVFKKVEDWFSEKDKKAIAKKSSDFYFYFKRD